MKRQKYIGPVVKVWPGIGQGKAPPADQRGGRGTDPSRRELSYDGRGINGPDIYRSRIATFVNDNEAGKKYGKLFEASPEMLAFLKKLLPDLEHGTTARWKGKGSAEIRKLVNGL